MEKLRIQVFKRKDNAWAARIVHWNGNILCTTHKKFETEDQCMEVIDTFLLACGKGSQFSAKNGFYVHYGYFGLDYYSDVFKRKDGKYDFRIVLKEWDSDASSENHIKIFSSSQGYEKKKELLSFVGRLFLILREKRYKYD